MSKIPGTGHEEFYQDFFDKGYEIGLYHGNDDFSKITLNTRYDRAPETIKLVAATPEDMGFPKGDQPEYDDVLRVAKSYGLKPCPFEVLADLPVQHPELSKELDYEHQVLIATDPVPNSLDEKSGVITWGAEGRYLSQAHFLCGQGYMRWVFVQE